MADRTHLASHLVRDDGIQARSIDNVGVAFERLGTTTFFLRPPGYNH